MKEIIFFFLISNIMAETDEKAKYAQVPQSEEHAAKEKEQPEEGAVRLQAKMGLVMIANNMQYTDSHMVQALKIN